MQIKIYRHAANFIAATAAVYFLDVARPSESRGCAA